MLNWDNLCVVTTAGAVPHKTGWEAGPEIFAAETCMRHIYVGMQSSFGARAEKLIADRHTQTFVGFDAYRFFVQFYAGLRSHYHSDMQTSHQARKAWKTYAEANPETHTKIKPYVDDLFHDGGLITSEVLGDFWRRPTLTNVAVESARLTQGDQVLVIGGAETLTKDVILALAYRRKHTPSTIGFTHSNRFLRDEILHAVRQTRGHEALHAEIAPSLFITR